MNQTYNGGSLEITFAPNTCMFVCLGLFVFSGFVCTGPLLVTEFSSTLICNNKNQLIEKLLS